MNIWPEIIKTLTPANIENIVDWYPVIIIEIGPLFIGIDAITRRQVFGVIRFKR